MYRSLQVDILPSACSWSWPGAAVGSGGKKKKTKKKKTKPNPAGWMLYMISINKPDCVTVRVAPKKYQDWGSKVSVPPWRNK